MCLIIHGASFGGCSQIIHERFTVHVHVAVPGKNQTLFRYTIQLCYHVRSAVAQNGRIVQRNNVRFLPRTATHVFRQRKPSKFCMNLCVMCRMCQQLITTFTATKMTLSRDTCTYAYIYMPSAAGSMPVYLFWFCPLFSG